jgi:tellurium resistance protein TerD
MGFFNKLFGGQDHSEQHTQPTMTATPIATEGHEVTLDLNKPGLLNLEKQDFLNLTKTNLNLSNIRVSAGWDVAARGRDYDLDLFANLLDSDGKLITNANPTVYYADKHSQGVRLDHDNLTGAGDGDDENMFVNFDNLPTNVSKIVIGVAIYGAKGRGQDFGHVKNAYVRLVDQSQTPEKEIVRFNLTEDGGSYTAVKFAEFNRTAEGWTFKAVGDYLYGSIESISRNY